MRSILTIILLSLISFSVNAGNFKITHGGNYKLKTPTTAHSYDGIARDVSKFYKSENQQFYIGGKYTFDNKRTSILSTYNNGFDSSKLDINSSLKIGVNHVEPMENNLYIVFSSSYTFGGEIRHTSCKDSDGVKYYCGNLTLWNESTAKDISNDKIYNFGLKLIKRF